MPIAREPIFKIMLPHKAGNQNRNQNRGQSTNLDTTAACILTRRSDQGGTWLHDHGCQDFLTDPYCLNRPLLSKPNAPAVGPNARRTRLEGVEAYDWLKN